MTLVVLPDPPSDGETADASDVNDQDNAIVAVVNGNLDDSNISSLSGTKITAGTIPATAMSASANLGWQALAGNFTSPTYLGNRSYSFTTSVDQSAILSPGMRLKSTRTVTAPTQCTSLNGTTQYYSKSSPSGMTFTDDFVVGAWVKLSSYAAGRIISRWDATNGWAAEVLSNGQVNMYGNNASASNYSQVTSYQSLPLNKWVHIIAQLDMSTFTATTTTSYIMIDGVDVPASVSRGGTNPTALVQGGSLQIGAANGGTFFPGKIAQAAIFSAKVTQATMRTYMSQGLAGTETSLISAYSFNNSINDLNTSNANNLTANGSAVATNADSPFTQNSAGVPGGSLDYAIVTAVTSSTVTCQVPEGCAIPTSGGISAVSYSTQGVPFGFPKQRGRWRVETLNKTDVFQSSPVTSTWYNIGSINLTIPIGEWIAGYEVGVYVDRAAGGLVSGFSTLSTGSSSQTDDELTAQVAGVGPTLILAENKREKPLSASSATPYYLNSKTDASSITNIVLRGSSTGATKVFAELAYL